LRFKNKIIHEYALHAYPSIPPNRQNSMEGKVTMRGLYLIPKGILENILINVLSIFYN